MLVLGTDAESVLNTRANTKSLNVFGLSVNPFNTCHIEPVFVQVPPLDVVAEDCASQSAKLLLASKCIPKQMYLSFGGKLTIKELTYPRWNYLNFRTD